MAADLAGLVGFLVVVPRDCSGGDPVSRTGELMPIVWHRVPAVDAGVHIPSCATPNRRGGSHAR